MHVAAVCVFYFLCAADVGCLRSAFTSALSYLFLSVLSDCPTLCVSQHVSAQVNRCHTTDPLKRCSHGMKRFSNC